MKKNTRQKESNGRKGSVTRNLEKLEGKAFSEKELTAGLNDTLLEAWEKLRAFADDLGKQRIYASKQSIMFAKKICYMYVRPRKTSLEVWIFLPRKLEGLVFSQAPTKKEKYCNLYKVTHADQVEEPLTGWLREAFEQNP